MKKYLKTRQLWAYSTPHPQGKAECSEHQMEASIAIRLAEKAVKTISKYFSSYAKSKSSIKSRINLFEVDHFESVRSDSKYSSA